MKKSLSLSLFKTRETSKSVSSLHSNSSHGSNDSSNSAALPKSRSGLVKVFASDKKYDDFAKLAMLGKGGVGKVYLVVEKETNRLYAMKILSKQEMIAREKVNRVIFEKDTLIALNHPFVVPLYYCFNSEKHVYMCMEYCAGGELYNLLQKSPGRRLSENVAKFFIAEIIAALEYLHLLGYIYRDLKPENVLIQASGHIMLADFDLSKVSEEQMDPKIIQNSKNLLFHINSDATLEGFKTNSFVGTEEYISPETLKGIGYSTSVDWWCLGVLLYEMLYGCTPFLGKNQTSTFRNILRKYPSFKPKDESLELSVSQEAKSILKKLLNKDHRKRLGSKFGAAEIKGHPFFSGMNFSLLRNETPPHKPIFKNRYDISHFKEFEINVTAASMFQSKNPTNSGNKNIELSVSEEDEEILWNDVRFYLQKDPYASKSPSNIYYEKEATEKQGNAFKLKDRNTSQSLQKMIFTRSTQNLNLRKTSNSVVSVSSVDKQSDCSQEDEDDPFKSFEDLTIMRTTNRSIQSIKAYE